MTSTYLRLNCPYVHSTFTEQLNMGPLFLNFSSIPLKYSAYFFLIVSHIYESNAIKSCAKNQLHGAGFHLEKFIVAQLTKNVYGSWTLITVGYEVLTAVGTHFYQTTRRYNPQDRHLRSLPCTQKSALDPMLNHAHTAVRRSISILCSHLRLYFATKMFAFLMSHMSVFTSRTCFSLFFPCRGFLCNSLCIRFQCQKILLATLRMSRDLWNSSRAPDGVCIALWFLGMTNPPISAEVQGLSKLSGQRRHVSC
jgi:hypothetical protein